MNHVSMENGSYTFLERSIGVLVVDDEPAVANLHFEHLNSYKLYDVTCASSVKEADSILSSSKRYHVCMLDLGVTDFDHDEYYLVRKYSPKVSFIVVSGRNSLEKGFQAGMCGALAAISKPVDFYKVDFIDLVNEAFLRSLIIPENINKCKPVIRDAVNAFVSFKPKDLMQWAKKIGVDERYLRQVWTDSFDYQPKYALWLYKIFFHAFPYYKSQYCEEFRLKTEAKGILFNDKEHDDAWRGYGHKRFYKDNKSTIDGILKNGKVKV